MFEFPRLQAEVKHAVNLGRSAALHLGDVQPGNHEADEAKSGKDITNHGAQVAGVGVVNVGQAETESGAEGAGKQPTGALGLGTEMQCRDFGTNSVRGGPDGETTKGGDEDEYGGAEPGNSHVVGDTASDAHT